MIEDKTALYHWCKSDYANAKWLAEKINRSGTFVSFMANGKKAVPPELIPEISAHTGIPARDLRPDLWEIFKDE